jgi:capsular polysaccharide biosynthesis protein
MDAFASGVFHEGQCLPDSLQSRAVPAPLLPVTRKLSGIAIFGGYLFGHFGHFLLESLARAYVFRQCGNFPILFMSPNDRIYDAQRKLFRFLNITNELLLIREPTEVEQLVMAPAGSAVDPPAVSDAQIKALGVHPAGEGTPGGERLWLSRSRFRGGGLDNEAAIEDVLRQWGWSIAHPESLTYREQVERVGSAAYVAGLDGSAFYSVLLAEAVRGRFFVFSRRNHIPPILRLVLEKKTTGHKEFTFPLTHVSGEGPERIMHLEDTEQILGPLRNISALP